MKLGDISTPVVDGTPSDVMVAEYVAFNACIRVLGMTERLAKFKDFLRYVMEGN